MKSDQEIINEYLDGGKDSFALLVSQYLKQVYNFAFSYVRNKALAEDITQETFIKVWKNLKKFNQEKSFKAWIFTITKNTALDHLRKKGEIPLSFFENEYGENLLAESFADPAFTPLEIFEQNEYAFRIKDVTDKLNSNHRLVFSMHYNDGLTFEKISESLGVSINTVKSRYRRALIKIRENLKF